eukprot:983-Heterococcus_DN1.PRE.2
MQQRPLVTHRCTNVVNTPDNLHNPVYYHNNYCDCCCYYRRMLRALQEQDREDRVSLAKLQLRITPGGLDVDATAEAAANTGSGSSSALSPATVTSVQEHDDDADDATQFSNVQLCSQLSLLLGLLCNAHASYSAASVVGLYRSRVSAHASTAPAGDSAGATAAATATAAAGSTASTATATTLTAAAAAVTVAHMPATIAEMDRGSMLGLIAWFTRGTAKRASALHAFEAHEKTRAAARKAMPAHYSAPQSSASRPGSTGAPSP